MSSLLTCSSAITSIYRTVHEQENCLIALSNALMSCVCVQCSLVSHRGREHRLAELAIHERLELRGEVEHAAHAGRHAVEAEYAVQMIRDCSSQLIFLYLQMQCSILVTTAMMTQSASAYTVLYRFLCCAALYAGSR